MSKSNEQLVRVRAIRAGNRGAVTKLIKESEILVKQLNEEKHDERLGRINTIYSLLGEKTTTLKELDEKVINLCEIEDIGQDIEEAEEVLFRILESKRIINDVIKGQNKTESVVSTPQAKPMITNQHQDPPINTNESPGMSNPSSSNDNIAIDQHLQVIPQAIPTQHVPTVMPQIQPKLPKLVLAKFRGEITKYRSFWDRFQSAVHNNPNLSTIDKFNYLNSLLDGRALLSIQGLAITEANYQSAIDILNQRFGNSQAIISAHMEKLMKLPVCNGDKVSQLRFLYDQISVHVRGLEALGVSSSQYGSLLIPVIMAKLPNEIKLQVARKTEDKVWEMSTVLNILLKEVEAREISETIKATTNTDNQKIYHPPSAAAMTTMQRGNSMQCAYCREFHFSASCDRVIDAHQRKEILRRDKRCFMCLSKNHRSNQCDPGRTCRRCRGNHHQSICTMSRPHPTLSSESQNRDGSSRQDHTEQTTASPAISPTTATTVTRTRQQILLQTAVANAQASEDSSKSIPVRILLDSGSQRSYITSSLKKRLGLLSKKTETLNLNTFGDERFTKQRCDVVDILLKGRNGNTKIEALCFPKICSPLTTTIDINRHPHLRELQLSDLNILDGQASSSCIDVLIGADYYFSMLTGEMVRGNDGPVAVNSQFGWIISGPTPGHDVSEDSIVTLSIEKEEVVAVHDSGSSDADELSEGLRRFWEIEALGIKDQPETDDDFLPAIEFKSTVGRYEVKLPWKNDVTPNSNGYSMCVKRLHQLKSRLSKDIALMHEYDDIIKEQINMGIIEPATEREDISHYLPHHGVVRQNKDTTKLRVVFDGSAKSGGDDFSLNDCLKKGPNLTPLLFDTIIKFRAFPIGITADIEKAFHQVQINPEDRQMLKFLWFGDITNDRSQIKSYQFRRLPFGLTPSPAILTTTIHHHLNQYQNDEPEVVSLLRDSMYVDDFAGGAHDDAEAVHIFQTSRDLMNKGGFNLRKWHTNSQELREVIATEEGKERLDSTDPSAETSQPSGPDSKPESDVKILGIKWNTDGDELYYDLGDVLTYAHSLPATKRSVLKLSAKVFDPVGLLTPFSVNMKMLFQTICTNNVNWDDVLEGQALVTWNMLRKELSLLNNVRVPRCYFHSNAGSPLCQEIHGFCDASDKAFAAVVYLRTVHSEHEVEVNLVASKSRVAPLKRQSIPRLELLGATLLARLVNSILRAMTSMRSTPRVVLWTDSSTTLCWIRNHKAWKQYVHNRVLEIRNLTNSEEWRHCPGHLNPADLPSRGCTGKQLVEAKHWWSGPSYLYSSEKEWPVDPLPTSKENETAYSEIVKQSPLITYSLTGSVTTDQVAVHIEKVVDLSRFSTKAKLLQVTAQVLRFIKILKKQTVSNPANEILEAEKLWIRSIQSTAFAEELRSIERKKPDSLVNQLHLYLDEDRIVRCQGRLSNSCLSTSAKNPILLPTKHYFTDLIVRENHSKVHHNGVRDTLNSVRERYWVPRGREVVKKLVRKCIICRKFEGKCFDTPQAPPLPASRVSESPPFTNTGIDFAGPLYAAGDVLSQKVYICLFTCASTRAVHLELVPDLSVPSFLQAFRRFSSRRGLPARLLTDNAKTYKSASKEVKDILRSREVERSLATKGVQWKFIIEKAPWHGGFWERMIGSAKRCLKKILGRTSLDFEALRTILVEVEATINNRPLTYVYDDTEGISYPLSPSQLIYGRQITSTPNDRQFEIISTNQSLTKRARYHKRLLDQFTKRWRNEYLLSLREASSKLHGTSQEKIAVGDVVLLKNDSTSRVFWKIATVQDLLRSDDGIVRSARVRVCNSERGKTTNLRRPIQHLVPLELQIEPRNHTQVMEEDNEPQVRTETQEIGPNTRCPKRIAAVRGEKQRRERTR